MFSIFLLGIIYYLGCFSNWHTCNGNIIVMESNPNVTGFTPNVVVSQTTSLYSSPINISLTVYQRPVNSTHKGILRVINGQTSIDSTNRCIGYGVSFKFLGQYPIINSADAGNGGCNAILGSECAQNIRNALQQTSGTINSSTCGMSLNFPLLNPPRGCPINVTSISILSTTFSNNGSAAWNTSGAWIYEQFSASTSGDYDEIMKYFVFVYVVGRPYSSGFLDSAIACLSTYNNTVQPTANQTNFDTRLTIGQNYFILFLLCNILSFLIFAH